MKTKLTLATIGIFVKAYMAVSLLLLLAERSKRKRGKLIHMLRKHQASISEG
jgi:hypothetical protein